MTNFYEKDRNQRNPTQTFLESERLYKTLLRTSPEAVTVTDLKGIIIDASQRSVELAGANSADDLIGRSALDFIAPEDHERALKNLQKTLKHKYSRNLEYTLLKVDGMRYIGEMNASLITDGDGNPKAFIATMRDVTERRKAEKALLESETRYRNLFENSPFSIILIDSNRIIRDSNPATQRLIGYKKKEIIGRAISNISIFQELIEPLEKFIKGEPQLPIELELYKKDGRLFWSNIVFTKIKIRNETFIQIMSHDITERKEAELLIKEEIEKLKELDQIRKDLISRVAHELKTPLMPVCAGTEFLKLVYSDKLGNEVLEIIEMIDKGGKRLTELVNKLVDVTRIEYDKLKLEKNKSDLSEIIRESSKGMKFLAEKRNININLVLPKKLYIELDKMRIEQVITNLLSNAIKNTPPKGRVTLMLEKYGTWAIISVSDTGVGFTEDEIKKIFTRFGKIERYEEGLEYVDIEGSGLGLYISKQIVDLHEGKIWVESGGRNMGCIFKVRLPINDIE